MSTEHIHNFRSHWPNQGDMSLPMKPLFTTDILIEKLLKIKLKNDKISEEMIIDLYYLFTKRFRDVRNDKGFKKYRRK